MTSLLKNSELSLEKADRIVSETLNSCDDGELYVEDTKSETIVLDDNKIKSSNYTSDLGYGFRAVTGDTVAYSHSNEISEKSLKNSSENLKSTLKNNSGTYNSEIKKTNQKLYKDIDPIESKSMKSKIEILNLCFDNFMESINILSKKLLDYLDPKKVKQVNKAYDFACEAHSGQYRSSGDPYVTHPIAVASILGSFRMDEDSLTAAMLHDVMEDSGIPKSVIEKKFNKEVANLVDGVSKLNTLTISSKTESQAENLQKMVLAMSKDIRVIVVKLADRLHNMRTLLYLDREKQLRIAKETLEIYAPIAHRIGMNNLYRELEDLAFKTIYPTRYERLIAAVKKNRGGQKRLLNKIQKEMSDRLLKEGIASLVEGREKHIYSIYRKMKERRRSFEEIMDVYAIKIIVDTPENCYRTLGHIHNMYKPVRGRFKAI